MKKIVRLLAKTWSYLKDNNDEDKITKAIKKYAIKRKLAFKNYKNRLEATQLENKINNTKKIQTDIDSIKKNYNNS